MPVHAHGGRNAGWVLKLAIVATLGLAVLELAAGAYGRSLALVSDACHNFSDALALLFTWFAFYVQTKAPSQSKTYGYHRAGVLAAFVGALGLLPLAGWLFYAGYRRIAAPGPEGPDTAIMMAMGAAGVAINGLITGALRRASRGQACPRVVLFHMAGDALAALSIVFAAVLIRFTGKTWLDPVLGMLIAGLTVWAAWDIIADSLNILLEGLPRGIQLDRVVAAIRQVPRVEDVHDVHVWSLGAHTRALSCHVRIPDLPLPEGEAILAEVNSVLEQGFQIRHTTIQLEHAACEAVNGCLIPAIPASHHHTEREL